MANSNLSFSSVNDFGNLEFLAQQIVTGFITGLHKSPFHGFSVEFAEHRLYNSGDAVRNIDWKLFARTDKFFVKRFEEETNLRCQIMMDASSSMYYPETGLNKFQFSALAGAALILLLKKQRDAFGLTLFSEGIEFHAPAKSTLAHQKHIFNELENHLQIKPQQKTTNMVANLHLIAEQIHKRSLVILFSDCLANTTSESQSEDLFDAFQHLKYNKHEVIIFNIHEQKHEIDFDFENRPYLFMDQETNAQIKLNPTEIKVLYMEKMKAFKHNLALKCAQYKIDLIDASLEDGFYPVLNAWLIKRNKMV
jgi:uncharacterized protein (DUF58 family)